MRSKTCFEIEALNFHCDFPQGRLRKKAHKPKSIFKYFNQIIKDFNKYFTVICIILLTILGG